MLQVDYVAKGKWPRRSLYDPVALMSDDEAAMIASMHNVLKTPQNNFRMFLDGQLVFDDELISGLEDENVERFVERQLEQATMPCLDDVFAHTARFLGEKRIWRDLLRVQAWACGEELETAAGALLKAFQLREPNVFEALIEKISSFEFALEGFEDCPCDASGVATATREMVAAAAQSTTVPEEDWAEGGSMRKLALKQLCRLLLGRTAHDISVLVNFARVTSDMMGSQAESELLDARFKRVGADADSQLWMRATIVDTDMKSADRLAGYGVALSKIRKAYERATKATL